MKKVFAMLSIVAIISLGFPMSANAQNTDEQTTAAEQVDEQNDEQVAADQNKADNKAADEVAEQKEESLPMHQELKKKFIEGGAFFMSLVALCLIFGLALCIERIIYLSLSKTNAKRLLAQVEEALNQGGVEAALDVCRNTRGPIASIFYQGLLRYDEGVDVVEKSVASYGGVQLGLLEKNLTWITLFISIAPSLGFMGTVLGMIDAFDKIQQAGDLSATLIAGSIKVALLTTLFGLIVAIILQLFYNYILTLVDKHVNEMEDASISLLDVVVKYAEKH